jgi:hypothetical protein
MSEEQLEALIWATDILSTSIEYGGEAGLAEISALGTLTELINELQK